MEPNRPVWDKPIGRHGRSFVQVGSESESQADAERAYSNKRGGGRRRRMRAHTPKERTAAREPMVKGGQGNAHSKRKVTMTVKQVLDEDIPAVLGSAKAQVFSSLAQAGNSTAAASLAALNIGKESKHHHKDITTQTTVESGEDDFANRRGGGEPEAEGEKPTLQARFNKAHAAGPPAAGAQPFGLAQTEEGWGGRKIPRAKNGVGNTKHRLKVKVTKTQIVDEDTPDMTMKGAAKNLN